jgi:peptidoglycan-associated lipoprotein
MQIWIMLVLTFYGMSCVSITKFSSGTEAFQRKHYFIAVSMLKNEIEKTNIKSDAFEKSFLIAESFKLMNIPDSAVVWYKKALDIADDELAFINLAHEYKKTENHQLAFETLENCKRVLGNSQLIQREISICRQALEMIDKKDQQIVIEKLNLNTGFSEFASAINSDKIFFSSDRTNNFKNRYGWTGNFFYDIYFSNVSEGSTIEILKGNVNSKFNESSPSLTRDGKTMYFVRCGEEDRELSNCNIYFTRLENGIWMDAEKLPFQKEGANYYSPRITDEGGRLYFASDLSGGQGGLDIYYVLKSEKGWSDPVRLPNSVNTPGNENFLTLWKNEIYFSSDFLSGLGGYDIFSSSLDPANNFTPPQNLKPPFNSGGDDFNLLKTSDSTGFFSSSRIGGSGLDDIYSYRLLPKYEEVIVEKNPEEKKDSVKVNKKLFLAVKVMENVYSDTDDPNSKILGKKPVADAVVRISGLPEASSDANGVVIREIGFDETLSITVGKNGYLTGNQTVTSEKENFYTGGLNTVNIRIVIEKIYLDKEIVLRNIYYDFDKWDLRQESESTLNVLYNILKNNPQFKINIGSHTDCKGDEEYNMQLSQKRAQSVVDYLIMKGLSADRIRAIGYGESNLIDKCDCDNCSEDQHQNNRRTTFELKSEIK